MTKAVIAYLCEAQGCNQIHPANGSTYIRVQGNIYLGAMGGLVGDNFDEDGRVREDSIFCTSCFMNYMAQSIGHEARSREANLLPVPQQRHVDCGEAYHEESKTVAMVLRFLNNSFVSGQMVHDYQVAEGCGITREEARRALSALHIQNKITISRAGDKIAVIFHS